MIQTQTETPQQVAERMGLIFNGMQVLLDGSSVPMFTNKRTSFVVANGETIEEAMERSMRRFEEVKQ